MGAALAVKRGESKGFGLARKIAGQMSEKQIKEFATKPKSGKYPGKKKKT
jgi:Protein of unknwon function (DUF3008)